MIRELARVPGLAHVVHVVDLYWVPVGKDAKFEALRDLLVPESRVGDDSDQGDASAKEIELHWWFSSTPEQMAGSSVGESSSSDSAGGVGGIDFTHAGEVVHLDVDSVITAIDFVLDPMAVAKQGIWPVSPIPADGKISDGLFAIGLLKGNGRGTVPDQRIDARALAATIAAEVTARSISTDAAGVEPHAYATDFSGWRRIDLSERLKAGVGRCRAKLRTRSELFDAAQDDSLDGQMSVASASAAKDLAPGCL